CLAIVPKEGCVRVIPFSDSPEDLPAVVDRTRKRVMTWKNTNVPHHAILPNEGAPEGISTARTDDHALRIDARCFAPAAISRRLAPTGERREDPEVAHHAIVPQEGVKNVDPIRACIAEPVDSTASDNLTAAIP